MYCTLGFWNGITIPVDRCANTIELSGISMSVTVINSFCTGTLEPGRPFADK